MIKPKSRKKIKDIKTSAESLNWDALIADAEKMVRDHQDAVDGLKDSIRVFKARRDAGDPLPGRGEKREGM